jgi:hypothetical protein
MNINIQFWSDLAEFFLEWEMIRPSVVEKIKTRILYSETFFSFENHVVYENNVEKYGTDGEAPDDNMAYAHCMPGT